LSLLVCHEHYYTAASIPCRVSCHAHILLLLPVTCYYGFL
jgi:hypothetical protein